MQEVVGSTPILSTNLSTMAGFFYADNLHFILNKSFKLVSHLFLENFQMMPFTSSAIDFGVDFSRFFIYLKNGFLQQQYYWYIPFLFVASFVGSWLGKLILNQIDQAAFKKIALVFILQIGLSMLVKFLVLKA